MWWCLGVLSRRCSASISVAQTCKGTDFFAWIPYSVLGLVHSLWTGWHVLEDTDTDDVPSSVIWALRLSPRSYGILRFNHSCPPQGTTSLMSPWCPEAKSNSVQGHLPSRTLPIMTADVSECLWLVQMLHGFHLKGPRCIGQINAHLLCSDSRLDSSWKKDRDAGTTDGACNGDYFLLMSLKGQTQPSPTWHQDRAHLGSCWPCTGQAMETAWVLQAHSLRIDALPV